MGVKYLNNIDLNGNQILNVAMQNLGSDPGSPATGQFWLNTSGTAVAKYYTGASTITLWDADTAATASKLVRRDSSGNIAAAVATFTSVTISGTPSASTDAATKGYVDSVAQGLSPKPSAAATTTAALAANTYANGSSGVGATLTANANGAIAAIDGYTASLNDYVLVKNEAAGSHNGLYKLTQVGTGSLPYILTRAVEMDSSTKYVGSFVFVEQGTVNGSSGWVCATVGAITVGTTAITFTQFSGAGELTANAPLSLSGNALSVNLSSRVVNNGGNLDLQSGVVTTGTYTSVTVDTYGRVTTGADIVTSNGLVARTGAGTFTNRTVTGTASRISVTNGSGAAGNPTLDIDATYVGQASIVTLGTVTTGTWTGTAIAVANGGTGATTASAARANLSVTGKYSALVGDGSSVSIAITQGTHGLASNGQMIGGLFDASTGDQVFAGFSINNSNGTVTLTFTIAPASNAYRLVLVG